MTLADRARRIAEELILFAREVEGGYDKERSSTFGTVDTVPEERSRGTTQEKPQQETRVAVKPKKKTYDNDPSSPTYDPEPPFPIQEIPPRQEKFKEGELLIAQGSIKMCLACRKPAVIAMRDVHTSDLKLDAFEIMDKTKTWADKVEVDKKGGICVTCPLCGTLGLWLVGEPAKSKDQVTGSV